MNLKSFDEIPITREMIIRDHVMSYADDVWKLIHRGRWPHSLLSGVLKQCKGMEEVEYARNHIPALI
jgi:hypothetical protein